MWCQCPSRHPVVFPRPCGSPFVSQRSAGQRGRRAGLAFRRAIPHTAPSAGSAAGGAPRDFVSIVHSATLSGHRVQWPGAGEAHRRCLRCRVGLDPAVHCRRTRQRTLRVAGDGAMAVPALRCRQPAGPSVDTYGRYFAQLRARGRKRRDRTGAQVAAGPCPGKSRPSDGQTKPTPAASMISPKPLSRALLSLMSLLAVAGRAGIERRAGRPTDLRAPARVHRPSFKRFSCRASSTVRSRTWSCGMPAMMRATSTRTPISARYSTTCVSTTR